jgi:hypothetical protein
MLIPRGSHARHAVQYTVSLFIKKKCYTLMPDMLSVAIPLPPYFKFLRTRELLKIYCIQFCFPVNPSLWGLKVVIFHFTCTFVYFLPPSHCFFYFFSGARCASKFFPLFMLYVTQGKYRISKDSGLPSPANRKFGEKR